jgi:hypothetical protein
MFLSHYAAGLAAKKWAPKISLGILFLAAVGLDLLWSFFLIFGWESVRIIPGITKVIPIDFTNYSLSHSLVMALAWAVLFGLISLILTKNEKISLVLAGLVVSNWLLNMLFHHTDMYLLPASDPGSAKWGLGLWNSTVGSVMVELVLFAAGLWVYLKFTKAGDVAGKWGLWILCGTLAAVFVLIFNLPIPSNVGWVAVAGQIQLLFVAWGFWLDDHRKSI